MTPEELAALAEELHSTARAVREMQTSVQTAVANLDERVATATKEQLKPLLEKQAELEGRLDQAKVEAARIQTTEAGAAQESAGSEEERTGGFRNFGDFLQTMLTRKTDPRVVKLHERVMSMGTGAAGGFLVPPQFAEMLTAIRPQDAIVRPRAVVIPAGTPPDSPITMPLLNQSGARGVYSGVTVTWVGEGQLKPETEPEIGELTLTPHEVSAHTTLTDKLIRNAPAASVVVERLLRDAILAAEDVAFISGNGVGQPLGFLGHPSAINVVRAGAGAIAYADVVNMYSRILLGGGNPVWIGNPSILPQLQSMASVLGQLVWQPSAREGEPSSLLGIPFLRNQRQPVLGAIGDLMLVNLGYYLIKDGSPLTVQDDGGLTNFTTNRTVIKAFWNVDGQPWLTTPLLLEDGVSTASPFVVLQ